MRLLGVDFGFKRIGLAVAETDVRIASPRPGMAASGTLRKDAETICRFAKSEEAQEVVLGYPLGDEGEAGRMARIARTLAGHLEQLGCRVHLVDESLTSVQAESTMAEAGMKASDRRKRRDSEAACLILERFMEAGP